MRKSIHKFLALALAICMLVPMLAACKQEIDAAAIMSQYRLSNSAIELSVGDVSGVSLVDESLSDVVPGQDWSSDNPAVATVVGGIITAVGEGTATIKCTVTREDIEPFDLTCTVTVIQNVIPVESIMLSSTAITLDVGTESIISSVVLPTDATDKTVVWTSSNPTVASVSGGIIRGISEGTAEIKASSADGLVSSTCMVIVNPLVDDLTSFSINKTTASLKVGNSTTLKVSYEPAEALVSVVWTSSDNSVATVTDGVVKAIAAGTATITASYTDKVTTWEKTCKVTVTKASSGNSGNTGTTTPSKPTTIKATGVKLDKNNFFIYIGETSTWKITPTVTPANTTEKGTWTSSDPSLVTIDSNGNAKVVATSLSSDLALETVTLTYTVGSVSAPAIVVLSEKRGSGNSGNTGDSGNQGTTTPSTGVNLTALGINPSSASVKAGSTVSLTATKSPANSDETITWSSADPTVATVDQNGTVTGLKAGSSVVIYAKSSRTGLTAACSIMVTTNTTAATGITLTPTTTSIEIGSYVNLKATLIPATANETIVWSSSVPAVASVDQTGRVTGIAMGATVITATTASGKSASCQVTVTAATVKNVTVSVSISATGDLMASKSYTATLKFVPALSASDMADFLYAIDSDAPNVVSATNDYVTNSFTLVAGDDGSATLTPYIYTEKKNINFTYAPLTVTVNSPSSDIKNPITAISLSVSSGSTSLYVGDTMGLAVQVSPADHDDICSWSSSDNSVATVDEGIVTAVGVGTAKITYKAKGNLSKNGVSKSITVTVKSIGGADVTLGRITIAQGSTIKATMNSNIGALESWVPGNGCLVVVGSDGTITCPADAPIGNGGQVICYYVDANNQYQMKTFNVIIVRAVTTSDTAYAKYTISTKDGQAYNLASLGLDPFGKTFEAAGASVNCDFSVSASGNLVVTLSDVSKTGTASIYVKDAGVIVARIDVSTTAKTYSITVNKSSTIGVSLKNSISDLSNANISSVSISNNDLVIASSNGAGDFYIKSKNNMTGSTTAIVSYTVGGTAKQITVSVNVQ